MDNNYSLKIGHLFPDLLNLYGDGGNISALKKRMEWRGMDAEVVSFEIDSELDFGDIDIILLGGGGDREQLKVLEKLKSYKKAFAEYVEKGGVVLAVCGGFSMLGKSCVIKDEVTDGLGILDFYTEAKKDRFIGNVIVESNLDGENVKIAGFENHGGLTFIGDLEPFGKVLFGNGNNGKDEKEGVLYKNLIGSYLHGPLLPKNAKLTDFILNRALKQKYGEEVKLTKLDDSLEDKALEFMLKKCNIN